MEKIRKGIILAGGNGTRLNPVTCFTTKQFINVYDKPLIYYPIDTLLSFGIRQILMIFKNEYDLNIFKNHFQDANKYLGIDFEYAIQENPIGIADAFNVADRVNFIKGNEYIHLILGDNLFWGNFIDLNFYDKHFFTINVKNPEKYGVYNKSKNIIVEKPKIFISKKAVPGLYCFESDVVDYVKNLKPSFRNELEITDLINIFLQKNDMSAIDLEDDFVWFDCGDVDDLLDANNFVKSIQTRTNSVIGCIEKTCFEQGFTDRDNLKKWLNKFSNNTYKNHIISFLNNY